MSINGVLEDLALADVLQFVHLGQRTGTLYMWQDEERRAEIGFHDGKIISAWTPEQSRLGDLLVEGGLLAPGDLASALRAQNAEADRRPIGKMLIDSGVVHRDDIYKVIREQIEATIFDLVTWQYGNFHFEVDELNPVDEVGIDPTDLLRDLDLNTQMLLLEATRIFDEKNRYSAVADAPPPTLTRLDRDLRRAGLGGGVKAGEQRPKNRNGRPPRRSSESGPTLEAIRCQVVTQDDELLGALHAAWPDELVKVVSVRLREAGTRLPGEAVPPLVVLDLRLESLGPEDIATLARTRPTASVLAVVNTVEDVAPANKAGAIAVVVGSNSDWLIDCCRNLVRVFSHPQPQGTFGYGHGGFSSFRRALFDVQSGLLSATMALNLMHLISESVERAVLFLVKGDELRAVGAFGFAADDAPLARLTSGLYLEPEPTCALRRALADAKPLAIDFDDADLPLDLAQLLGRPSNGQVVIFPVLGAVRPISVIYTDNGTKEDDIQDIKILELATSQVGVAFENELLSQEADGDFGGEE
jgi:hypothetical protein